MDCVSHFSKSELTDIQTSENEFQLVSWDAAGVIFEENSECFFVVIFLVHLTAFPHHYLESIIYYRLSRVADMVCTLQNSSKDMRPEPSSCLLMMSWTSTSVGLVPARRIARIRDWLQILPLLFQSNAVKAS